MHSIPRTADYDRNYARHRMQDAYPCLVCGKAVTKPNAYIRIFYGSDAVTTEEAADIIAREGDGGDTGYYPIGSNCLRNHPELQQYVRRGEL